MSGITDPYKLYRHIHPSEVGTCVGSCTGGNHCEEKKVMVYLSHLNFINTTAGWISLMSSSGPVKIPVSVCATTLQSIEVACDIIIFNKAKMMIAGGFNDISEEGSSKFANVKATSNAETEFAMGHEHTEMLRPATTTCTGFSGSHPTASWLCACHISLSFHLDLSFFWAVILLDLCFRMFHVVPLNFQDSCTTQRRLLNGVYHTIPAAAIMEKVRILQIGIMQHVLHDHRAVGFLLDILQTWHLGLSRNYKTKDASNFQKEP
ncbi:hypothetical protein BKA83DRAFT_4127763 [Pisolithus microcarpus]|nr:hypothetical protein BKA83DRAFT_4127763 [Pisolithus microcarpus]